MHPNLAEVADQGANVISPFVETEEKDLSAFVTFIASVGNKIYAGLGNNNVQSFYYSPEDALTPADIFDARGLPLCVCKNQKTDNGIMVGTDNSELLEIDNALQTSVSMQKGWIEHISHSSSGLVAFSINKNCYVVDESGEFHEIHQEHGSVTGLQFNSNGSVLAISRYDGVTLWDSTEKKISEELEQKGAHLNLTWSPDDQYIVTTTPDKEIHCWEMPTKTSFRMRGYPSKIRSLCWTADQKHLAAAGADSVTVWPFVNGNPSGKPPYEFGYSFEGTVTEVAAHPSEALIAAGYDNGTVLIGKYLKGEAIIARAASNERISAMSWADDGKNLFVGTETGKFSHIGLKDFNF